MVAKPFLVCPVRLSVAGAQASLAAPWALAAGFAAHEHGILPYLCLRVHQQPGCSGNRVLVTTDDDIGLCWERQFTPMRVQASLVPPSASASDQVTAAASAAAMMNGAVHVALLQTYMCKAILVPHPTSQQVTAAAAAAAVVKEAVASTTADMLEGVSEEERAARAAQAKEQRMRQVGSTGWAWFRVRTALNPKAWVAGLGLIAQ